jgi:hypothetical protein
MQLEVFFSSFPRSNPIEGIHRSHVFSSE